MGTQRAFFAIFQKGDKFSFLSFLPSTDKWDKTIFDGVPSLACVSSPKCRGLYTHHRNQESSIWCLLHSWHIGGHRLPQQCTNTRSHHLKRKKITIFHKCPSYVTTRHQHLDNSVVTASKGHSKNHLCFLSQVTTIYSGWDKKIKISQNLKKCLVFGCFTSKLKYVYAWLEAISLCREIRTTYVFYFSWWLRKCKPVTLHIL